MNHQEKNVCGFCGNEQPQPLVFKSKDVKAFEQAFKNSGNVKSPLVEEFKSFLKFFKNIL